MFLKPSRDDPVIQVPPPAGVGFCLLFKRLNCMEDFWSGRFMKVKSIVLCRHYSGFVADGKLLPARAFLSMPEHPFACRSTYAQHFALSLISCPAAGKATAFYRTIQKVKPCSSLITKTTNSTAVIARQLMINCKLKLAGGAANALSQTYAPHLSLSFSSLLNAGGAYSLSNTKEHADKPKHSMSKPAGRSLLHHWSCKQKVAKPVEKAPKKELMYLSGLLSQFLCAIAAFSATAESLLRVFC